MQSDIRGYSNPVDEWYIANPVEKVGKETYRLVRAWEDAAYTNSLATEIEDEWEAWWGDRTKPVPDLVQLVSYYGQSRLMTQGWKEVPIKVPADQADRWNDDRCGLGADLADFRSIFQAGVVGGFFQEAIKDPSWLGETLTSQVAERLARLKELTNTPREEFTPVYLNMVFEHGEQELHDWLGEEEGYAELDRVGEPAALYEILHCFSWGLQKFRMFATSLNEPEFGLPSKAVYDALMQVDLNDVLDQLAYAEPKLKDILAWIWSKDPNFVPDIDYMPKSFWWRHVREHMETKDRKNDRQRY